MHTKRPRGRPAGSGIDDSRFLNEVADLLLANTRLKPTTAMRRVITTRKGAWIAHSEEAMLRRLQDKWKAHKAVFTAEAQRRQQPSVTISDVIEAGIALHAAYRRIMTPENIEKAIRTINAVNERIREFAEPLTRLQQHPMFRPENLQKFAYAAERIRDMDRVSLQISQARLR
ncbi:hypothetical protein FHS26_006729 [Rhizobium pisi]|jgi:hypothetical protein|uniref:Uncharacterized protein n=2 Tax=Rhizobium TaxID=379 RepID=A0A427M7R4_9HYPH|nr:MULTISPECIES: hypothetical protein [Rhizobium]MBB3138949.1 hypothetical protein [Rhizobium pisi]RSB60438.1 hypothetical protein EFD55_31635 [Rhizobium pisi]TCA42625.1 hypothetical protein E0J16_33080 [Rhizobium pisi]SCB52375.1 hypothetical protein GA0061101_14914 [Rhizobium lusitanum]